jgi:hypothetical protein
MTEDIRIEPDVWRMVAGRHDDAADIIARSQLAGPDIADALRGYGPIMHRTKVAAADVLILRDAELRAHGGSHRNAAEALRRAAATFAATEDHNTERLRLE